MFDENNLVTDVTENVEETTEEMTTEEDVNTVDNATVEAESVEEKLYSESELNARVDELLAKKIGGKLSKQEKKLRKAFEKELAGYKEAESVLNAGLGTSNIKEATENLREFYTKKGVDIPKYSPSYNEYDMKAGVKAEVQDMIDTYDFDELEEEANRLADIGLDNMSNREKEVFKRLGDYLTTEKSKKELASIGVTDKDLNDNDYIEFKKNLNPNMSEKQKYEMYTKYKPKPKVEPIGSMKGTKSEDSTVKDNYTYEEAMKFTKADFDKNPKLYEAVQKSMLKWK